ncbi:PREDICTED: zinc finger protein 62-like [Nicrophorus vespilloides]|uniref:Zinc finger protein 62-like n=1 Tax=Nicrophorus vespilloides TaxID=110193 RepID=A0ABM1N9J1_NICVS|nr:PREDICTED: zinc finger protein 62-like [Nicrophorus vespilloides]
MNLCNPARNVFIAPKDYQGIRYNCDKCKRSYKVKRSLWRHIKYECQQLPRFQCECCLHWFKHKSSMMQHYYTKHAEGVFTCDYCKKSYARYQSFYMHKKYDCEVAEGFRCPATSCNFTSKRKHNMKRHFLTHHNASFASAARRPTDRKRACTSISDTTAARWRGSRALGVRIAAPGSLFYCETCNASYVHKNSLYVHRKYYCGNPCVYACGHSGCRASAFHLRQLRQDVQEPYDFDQAFAVRVRTGGAIRLHDLRSKIQEEGHLQDARQNVTSAKHATTNRNSLSIKAKTLIKRNYYYAQIPNRRFRLWVVRKSVQGDEGREKAHQVRVRKAAAVQMSSVPDELQEARHSEKAHATEAQYHVAASSNKPEKQNKINNENLSSVIFERNEIKSSALFSYQNEN